MTAQLSRERLQLLANPKLECTTFSNQERAEMARMLLAGLDSKPVAYRWSYGENTNWRLTQHIPSHGDNDKCPRVIQPLYAAPPAPVGVPDFDEWSRSCDLSLALCYSDFREKAKYIWSSACAATLKAGPVTGWIKCSEQMPPLNNGQMWIYSPTRGVQFMFALAASGEYYDTCDSEEDITDATHWMPISIPAAPEQVV